MMFGPDSTISPTSPGGHSVPSGRTTLTSVKNCALPADPTWLTASALSRDVPGGADGAQRRQVEGVEVRLPAQRVQHGRDGEERRHPLLCDDRQGGRRVEAA